MCRCIQCNMILEYLDSNSSTIQTKLREQLLPLAVHSDYLKAWKDYEDAATQAIKSILKSQFPQLGECSFSTGETGKSKNRMADLLVVHEAERILISVKACRSSKNPANDLGTFSQYPMKERTHSGIFDIWVRYDDARSPLKVTGVFFDRSFKFVGMMTKNYGGGVAYRKKTGYMRPKKWKKFDDGTSHWNTLSEFKVGMEASIIFRAQALVEQHLKDMSEYGQRALYEVLKAKFEKTNGQLKFFSNCISVYPRPAGGQEC